MGLPEETLRVVYLSLVHSHLRYGIINWGLTCKSFINRLSVVQNNAIRSICGINRRKSATPGYTKLRILKIPELCKYEIANFMFKVHHNQVPSQLMALFKPVISIHHHNTRSSSSKNLYITRMPTNKTQQSLEYMGPLVWNSVPPQLKDLSLSQFKQAEVYFVKYAQEKIIQIAAIRPRREFPLQSSIFYSSYS